MSRFGSLIFWKVGKIACFAQEITLVADPEIIMSVSTSTKRLMQELNELLIDPSPEFKAEPLETDILEWHFSIRGPPNSCYEGGRCRNFSFHFHFLIFIYIST
jgi:hypothetical protein